MRVREDIPHAALLYHGAVIQNGNVAAHILHHAHLVGNDNHRNAHFAVDLLDQLQNGVGGVGVQGTGGFVTQQHLGVGGQGTRNGNALLLPAGKLRRVSVRLVRQANQLQQLPGAGCGFLFGHTGQFHGEADVLQAGTLHQQVELLEDHRDLPPGIAQLCGAQLHHFAAVHDHLALVRAFQHIDAPHQRGLACAGHADNTVNIAVLNFQVDVVQGNHRCARRGKPLCQVLDLDHNFWLLNPKIPCVRRWAQGIMRVYFLFRKRQPPHRHRWNRCNPSRSG